MCKHKVHLYEIESNKARARKPRSMPKSGANMTDKRKGKIAYGENDKCNDW